MSDAPTPVPDVLFLHAQANPDKVALIDDQPGKPVTRLTFAELNAYVNKLANGLAGLGAGRGSTVLWCGQNSIPTLAITHAGRKLGATTVPLNYRLTGEEAAYVTDDSDAAIVFVDAEQAAMFAEVRDQIPKVKHIVVFGAAGSGGSVPDGMVEAESLIEAAGDAEPVAAAGDSATMIYTSGTTGRPKGAVRRGGGDPSQTAALIGLIGYGPADVYMTTGPLYHSGPGGFATLAHALGNTIVLQRKFDAEDWLRLLQTYEVTATFSAPAPIRLICNLPADVKANYDTSSMRVMIANAAPWSFALKQAYLADFPAESLWEVYGSTELGVDCVLAPADQLRKPGSCGLAAPGVEIKLFDDDGNEVTEPHVPGELYVRTASAFATYHKADEKYEEGKRGEFHTVGDVAYRDDEGYFYICDRKNDMIISGGMNIYPAEIEAAIESHPNVFDVAVFGIPSDEWGEGVHAVVVAQPEGSLTQEDVIAYAREHLASYKIPRSVTFADELPRTGSGKILKRELRAPFWAGRDRQVG